MAAEKFVTASAWVNGKQPSLLRFFAVAGCIFFFGPSIKQILDKYLELATVVFAVLLIGGFVVIKWLL